MERLDKLITVGADGKWSLELENNFQPGFHAYVVESLETGLKDVGFFFIKSVAELSQQIQVSPILSFGIAVLLALVLFLAWYAVKLDRKIKACEIKTEIMRLEHEQKHLHKAIFISSFSVLIALVVVFGINRQFKLAIAPQFLQEAGSKIQEIIIPTVSGTVVDPITSQPQNGVDLSTQDVTVKTSDSGRYVFNQLDISIPLKITHPSLRRELAYYLTSSDTQIFFDANMFNFIVSELEKEDELFKSSQILEIMSVEVAKGNVLVVVAPNNQKFDLSLNSVGDWQRN